MGEKIRLLALSIQKQQGSTFVRIPMHRRLFGFSVLEFVDFFSVFYFIFVSERNMITNYFSVNKNRYAVKKTPLIGNFMYVF